MKFIVDLVLDGYENEENHQKACISFIEEQLDFSGSDVKVELYDEKKFSELENENVKYRKEMDKMQNGIPSEWAYAILRKERDDLKLALRNLVEEYEPNRKYWPDSIRKYLIDEVDEDESIDSEYENPRGCS